MPENFSELDKKLLFHFVTSTDAPIYAVKPTVPPEVFGAFGSYFSRNPKDFRIHLLNAIKGQVEEEEVNTPEEKLAWLVNGNFKQPSDAIIEGIAKAQSFFQKWYGRYSHKSIANTVWVPMVATNVSQLFAKELAYDQLAFFIEQSTRYVRWGTGNMFLDPRVINSRHKDTYIKTLEEQVKSYDALTDVVINAFKDETPIDSWKKLQSEETLKMDEKWINAKYDREIRGKALDVSRFLLPQAITTNIAWILDARSTEWDIAAWKGHPLTEIVDAANLIEAEIGKIAGSIIKYLDKNPYYSDALNMFNGDLPLSDAKPFGKNIDIISYDRDALNKSLTNILMKHNRGGNFRQRYDEVKNKSFDEKMEMLERVTRDRTQYDEWVSPEEDFDLIGLTLEISTDIGAIRDWRRHQKWDRGEALYTLDNGVHVPYMLKDMEPEALNIFERSVENAHKSEKKIRGDFPFEAQYVVPMATMHSIRMRAGLDQLQYMLWTRSTPQGNFSYRKDAFRIAEESVKLYPWLLGYETYPEGKDFLAVYRGAPLKNLLRLQVGEAELHQ